MTNDKTITKARKDLNSIISNLAYNDFKRTNTNKQGKFYKKRRPYNLSFETLEAYEKLRLLNTNNSNITKEMEEEVKAYLIPFRTNRTELLINTDPKLR